MSQCSGGESSSLEVSKDSQLSNEDIPVKPIIGAVKLKEPYTATLENKDKTLSSNNHKNENIKTEMGSEDVLKSVNRADRNKDSK